MADDVKPDVIKKTQDSLGKYFKKPPLTEKLLRKPPFRFLHDIVTSVIKETGFLDGLFTEEELSSDNIKTKEAKLAFLTKLIDVVKLATDVNLTVRASKIISGQEPTKTNELLQAIGKALDKRINSTEAIEYYKKGKAASKNKLSTGKEEKRASSKEVAQKRVSTGKEKSGEQKRKLSNANNTATNDVQTRKDEIQESPKNVEVLENPAIEQSRNKVPSSAHRRKSSARTKQNSIPSDAASLQANVNTDKNVEENKKQKEFENKLKHTVHNESNESQNQISYPLDTLESRSVNNRESNKTNVNTEKIEYKENEVLNNGALQDIDKSDQVASDVQKSENIEASVPQSTSRPKTSLRPPSARPISARPAAPRIRGKAELIINEDILTPMGNISVIVENADSKEDDDAEDMVVMETRASGNDSLENNGTFKVDDQLTQEHGHLVAQILETQKELVNNDNVDVIPKKTNIAWDSNLKRDVVTKEVDKLRNTIQTLTRATNPLGKLLDYLQEDVEIMQKELLEWKSQYQQLNEQLRLEEIKTQELIEPMKDTLKEIDHNVKLQLDQICQAKSRIMKNDSRIQTLLNGQL